jgi:hypothetical protein
MVCKWLIFSTPCTFCQISSQPSRPEEASFRTRAGRQESGNESARVKTASEGSGITALETVNSNPCDNLHGKGTILCRLTVLKCLNPMACHARREPPISQKESLADLNSRFQVGRCRT